MVFKIYNIESSHWLKFNWEVSKPEEKKEVKVQDGKCHLKRRHLVTMLGFLCSIVMHSQRLNISIAMVAMVNSTESDSFVSLPNDTDCPVPVSDINSKVPPRGEFNWNPELQGYILSAGYLGYSLTQIPGGILAGRFGSKPILLLGLLSASICNLLSPVAAKTHAYLLAAVQLVRGMGQGMQQPAMSVLMSKWFPRSERGFLSAFIFCGYPMGAFLGSLAAGPLCEATFLGGWPLVFYVFGLFGVFISLLMQLLYSETPTDDPNISESELKHILSHQEGDTSLKNPPIPWGAILTSFSTYSLTVAQFGQNWMTFYFLSVHPLYLGTILNIPIKENGILSSGPYVAQAIAGFSACMFAYWLNRSGNPRINTVRKGCNTLGGFIFTIGIIGIYLSGCSHTWNEVCLFIGNASVGFAFAGCLITSVDMSPTFCGPLMGFCSTIASVAGFVVPVTVGALTNGEQTMVQWHKMFLITASVAASCGFVFLTLGSTDIQPYDPASSKKEDYGSSSKL